MSRLVIGDVAPLWELDDQDERRVALKDHRGNKNVLIAFHPLAWTAVCAQQMKDLESHREEFEKNNTIAFGLSVDSVPCKHAWAKSLGIVHTRLPSDFWPHGGVAKLYDVFDATEGVSARSVFLVDEEGTIAFKKIYTPAQVPDIEEIVNVVRRVASPPVGSKVR